MHTLQDMKRKKDWDGLYCEIRVRERPHRWKEMSEFNAPEQVTRLS